MKPREPNKSRKTKTKEMTKKYKRVFGTIEGKEVYEDLLKDFYFIKSYVKGDSHETAFREGGRTVVAQIMKHVEKVFD